MPGKGIPAIFDEIASPTTPPEESDSRDVKIQKLRKSLAEMRVFPVPHVMRSFSQWLAELTMESDLLESVFHLTESHGIGLRLLLETCWKLNPATLDDGRHDLIRCVSMRSLNTAAEMIDRLAALPKEWTVVQLSAGGFEDLERAWLTVLPTGPTARQSSPAVRLLQSPPGLSAKLRTSLEKRGQGLSTNNTRLVLMEVLQEVLQGMELWVGPWRFLLYGRLADRDLAHSAHNYVSDAIRDLSPANKTIALRLAEATKLLNSDELDLILMKLGVERANWPDLPAKLPQLASARRQTLVLILDQTLDMFPWEGLASLKNQPITRIESLHILHMLYCGHAKLMKDGLLMLPRSPKMSALLHSAGDPDTGLGDLTRMRECLGSFLSSRAPRCRVVEGNQAFVDGLQGDVFMYAGHGSGSQVTKLDEIQEHRVRAVVLLMGCESGRFRHYGGNTMYWGAPHAYHIAASPCVLGLLWSVLDRPLNSLTVAMLHCWLPLGKADPSLGAHVDPSSYVQFGWQHSAQPELLRALAVARHNAADAAVKLGFVARGLPVAMYSG